MVCHNVHLLVSVEKDLASWLPPASYYLTLNPLSWLNLSSFSLILLTSNPHFVLGMNTTIVVFTFSDNITFLFFFLWAGVGYWSFLFSLQYQFSLFCQTPTPGQTWELTLLLRGNKKKKKNNNNKNPHPNSPRGGFARVFKFGMQPSVIKRIGLHP